MKKTVKSIIENILAFHSGLSRYFTSLKEKALDKRAEILLEYMSRREAYIASHLKNYLDDTHDKTLNLWIKVVPCLPGDILKDCKKDLTISSPLDIDDIIEIAFHYDECLIDFLSILEKETDNYKAKTMFKNLLNQARNEERKLSRNTSMFQDI